MRSPIHSQVRHRLSNLRTATITILSALFGLLTVSPAMNAQTQEPACSLQVIRTPAENLYLYQLHLRCPDTGETVQYTLEVTRQGKSGNSRNQQSGNIKLAHPQLMLGNLRLNAQEEERVTVTGSITDQQNRMLAEVTRRFPEPPGE